MTYTSVLSQPSIVNLQTFCADLKPEGYLFGTNTITTDGSYLHMPLVVDTEFTQLWLSSLGIRSRLGITTQFRSVLSPTLQSILVHPAFEVWSLANKKTPRHRTATSGVHFVDFLQQQGLNAHIKHIGTVPEDLDKCKILHVYLYAFFALAEFNMIWDGKYKEDVEQLFLKDGDINGQKVEQARRLRVTSPQKKKGRTNDFVTMPWVVTIDETEYVVRLSFVDAAALHGISSYKDLCKAVGIELSAKDKMDGYKSRMHRAYYKMPKTFDEYALGDLEVYAALSNNAKLFKTLWKELGIEEYFEAPSLTIGSTVNKIFEACLLQLAGIPPKDSPDWTTETRTNYFTRVLGFFKRYIDGSSVQTLRTSTKSSECLLAKVFGGRAKNNRPTTAEFISFLADLDIGGAYVDSQRVQLYPLGTPMIISYDVLPKGDADELDTQTEYLTLGEFLDGSKLLKHQGQRKELVPGLWHLVVQSKNRLKYAQDKLISWYGFKYCDVKEMMSDTENERGETDEDKSVFEAKHGTTKVLTHEVINGPFTSDDLDWLDNICGKQQRAELLKTLVVKAAIWYPKSERVDSFEELERINIKHLGKRKTAVKVTTGNSTITKTDETCKAWFAVTLGELMQDKVQVSRKFYQKKDGKKSPLDLLFKLVGNTAYGDQVSKYFRASNTVVGNNITSRVRSLCWYMEKGLNGFQSITDGTAFDLSGVVYKHNKDQYPLTATDLTNLHRYRAVDKNIILKPLGEFKKLSWTRIEDTYVPVVHLNDGTKLENKNALSWVNNATMLRLQELFPKVSVLHDYSTGLNNRYISAQAKAAKVHGWDKVESRYIVRKGQFVFEAKGFYTSGVFHGTANYALTNPNMTRYMGDGKLNIAMRSYENKKRHQGFTGDTVLKTTNSFKESPGTSFLKSLETPKKVPLQAAFLKTAILKPGQYRIQYKSVYERTELKPGDSFLKVGLLRPFSLSQFPFKTKEQQTSWENAILWQKEKYGMSVECFFLEGEFLNFQQMICTIDELIEKEVMNPFTALDPKNHRTRDKTLEHPSFQTYLALKARIKSI